MVYKLYRKGLYKSSDKLISNSESWEELPEAQKIFRGGRKKAHKTETAALNLTPKKKFEKSSPSHRTSESHTKMQAELKTKEREGLQEFLAGEIRKDGIEVEEMLVIKLQKDLEAKLIEELLGKLHLQQLEKKVVEEEEAKQVQEEEEEQEEILHGYSIEFETFYSKDRGAYQVQQPYEQDHGNQAGYENKQ